MRVLKLHYPSGHPYWQEGEYEIEMPNGKFYNLHKHHEDYGHGFMLEIKPDGIYYQIYYCGSGYGKVIAKDKPAKLIISSDEYDEIEYVGEKKEMSETLKNDLNEMDSKK